MSINQKIATKVGGVYVVSQDVDKADIPNIVATAKVAKSTLDIIQTKLGTVAVAATNWDNATASERQEFLRKSSVAQSEIIEELLRVIVFLAGDKLD